MKRSGPDGSEEHELDLNILTSPAGKKYILINAEPLEKDVEGPSALIGKGAFGTITFALSSDGKPLAAKLLTLDRRDRNYPAIRAEINKECEIMRHLGREADLIEVKGEDPSKVMIYVMQTYIAGRSLASYFKHLIEKSKATEMIDNPGAKVLLLNEAITAFIATFEATQALHDKGVIHGDLHNGNVLYNSQTKLAKVIDFGMSYLLPPGQDIVYDSSEVVMTNMHRAPETVNFAEHRKGRKERLYERSSDGFSLAIDFCVDFDFTEIAPEIVNQEVVELVRIFKELSQEKLLGGTGRKEDRISLNEAVKRIREIQDKLEMRIMQEKLFEVKAPEIEEIATRFRELNTFKLQAQKAGLPPDIKDKIKELAIEMAKRREQKENKENEIQTPRSKTIAHHHSKERAELETKRSKLTSSQEEKRGKPKVPPAKL